MEDSLAARHIAFAKALEHVGNEKLMVDHLEKAAELEPTKESYTLLINAYRQRGMQEQADLLEDKVKKLITPTASRPRRMRVRRPKRVSL
jgi:Flp pilus assembly protein TadD